VVHVDFTVVIWFFSFAGIFWALLSGSYLIKAGWAAWWLCAIGAAIIAISPFLGAADPIINNYIPVLQSPIFFTGLGIFGAGFALLVLRTVLVVSSDGWEGGEQALRIGSYIAALIALFSLLGFAWIWFRMPTFLNARDYYETLFWGSGHIIQFTHAFLAVVAWFWLLNAAKVPMKIPGAWLIGIFMMAALPFLFLPAPIILYVPEAVEMKQWFTFFMQFAGPFPPLMAAPFVAWALLRAPKADPNTKPLRIALWLSMLLFGLGGGLALLIDGSSTIITAHYHGSTVAITLAYMALAYHLLPKFGFGIPNMRLAFWQVLAYGCGQMLHISGLAWAGSMGMKRKIAGSEQTLDQLPQIAAMGMMGIGGILAVIGGFMFFVAIYPSLRTSKNNN
ncbi:MAG: hypothetical protein R8L53_03045, partial [Mariprofundales bacterium]